MSFGMPPKELHWLYYLTLGRGYDGKPISRPEGRAVKLDNLRKRMDKRLDIDLRTMDRAVVRDLPDPTDPQIAKMARQAAEHHSQGVSVRKIAKNLSCSYTTVVRLLAIAVTPTPARRRYRTSSGTIVIEQGAGTGGP